MFTVLTYHQHFENRYFFNKFIDNIVILLSFLIWTIISIRHKITKWVTSLIVASALLNSITHNSPMAVISLSLVSLPYMIAINILDKALRRSVVSHHSLMLTLNYLLISVAILSAFSICVSVSSSDVNDPIVDMFILLSRFSPGG